MRPYKSTLAEPWKDDSKWWGYYYRDGQWHRVGGEFDKARDAVAAAKRMAGGEDMTDKKWCSNCGGSGVDPETRVTTCPTCGGDGTIKTPDRLDEPLTRRDVLAAIDAVVIEYSGSGFEDQDRIADAFRNLAKGLS